MEDPGLQTLLSKLNAQVKAYKVAVTAAKAPGATKEQKKAAKDQFKALGKLVSGVDTVNGTQALVGALTAVLAKTQTQGCFGAGTPLRTPSGSKAVEEFRVGDEILTRPEHDPSAAVEVQVVEEVFIRQARVLNLHVGGHVISTTAEHPFWVKERGWLPAGLLEAGDQLATDDEQWVSVEEVYDTGEVQTVYNLRVALHHTYFVGTETGPCCIWAHNLYNFLSGLKVAKNVQEALSKLGKVLSATDRAAIKSQIEDAGKYGAVGNLNDLVVILAGATNISTALQEYLALPHVTEDRISQEKKIDNRNQWKVIMPGDTKESYGFTAYIYTKLDDKNARGLSYAQANQAWIASGGDPTKQNQKIHGHHIVYKDGGTRAPAGLAASKDARDILLYYNINPYWDRANLTYAPNLGHPVTTIEFIRDKLKADFDKNASAEAIKQTLKKLADGYFTVNLPGLTDPRSTITMTLQDLQIRYTALEEACDLTEIACLLAKHPR